MKKTNKLPVFKYILEKVNISRLKVNTRGVRLTPRTALNGEREKKAADLLAAQMTPTLAEFPRRPLRRISNSVTSASTRWWRLSAASRSSAAPLRWKSDAANGAAAERSWKPGKIDPQTKTKSSIEVAYDLQPAGVIQCHGVRLCWLTSSKRLHQPVSLYTLISPAYGPWVISHYAS